MQYAQDYDEFLPWGFNNNMPAELKRWSDVIQPYTKSRQIFRCPSDTATDESALSYGTNRNFVATSSISLVQIPDTSGSSLACDAAQLKVDVASAPARDIPQNWNDYYDKPTDWQFTAPTYLTTSGTVYSSTQSNLLKRPVPRHFGGVNVCYMDGHAKWMRIEQFLGPMPAGWPHGDPRNSWDDQ